MVVTRPKKQKRYKRNKEKTTNRNNKKYTGSSSSGLVSSSTWLNYYLRSVEEMPKYLQFNTFIRKGYRELTDWKGCFLSLFFLHNETANILTHAPIAIYTLLYWKSFWPWDEKIKGIPYLYGLGLAHTIAMCIPWIPSTVYHLFLSHAGGFRVYNSLLRFDIIGIWMVEFFGSLTNIAASIWRLPHGLQGLLFGIFNISSLYGLIKAIKSKTPRDRVICFAPLLIGRILGIFLRLSPWGGGDFYVLHHVILQDAMSIVGGFIGVGRIPEKWIPGYCDYIFNSHNIMHIFVILAVYHMNEAANGDVRWIISEIYNN